MLRVHRADVVEDAELPVYDTVDDRVVGVEANRACDRNVCRRTLGGVCFCLVVRRHASTLAGENERDVLRIRRCLEGLLGEDEFARSAAPTESACRGRINLRLQLLLDPQYRTQDVLPDMISRLVELDNGMALVARYELRFVHR